jgi:hypothetical protein
VSAAAVKDFKILKIGIAMHVEEKAIVFVIKQIKKILKSK